MNLSEYQNKFKNTPCKDAQEWLLYQRDLQSAWLNCERGDWMIWALRNGNQSPEKSFWVKLASSLTEEAMAYSMDVTPAPETDGAAERKLQADWIRKQIPNFPQ